jgi:hypothetical protein
MIEFKQSSQFWQIWFVGAKGVDWLAAIYKHKGEGWTCKYRFRYHEDNKAHDSTDRKSWTTITTGETGDRPPESLMSAISMVAKMTASHFKGELHMLPVRCDGLKAAEALMRESWSHARIEPAGKAL